MIIMNNILSVTNHLIFLLMQECFALRIREIIFLRPSFFEASLPEKGSMVEKMHGGSNHHFWRNSCPLLLFVPSFIAHELLAPMCVGEEKI